MARGRGGAGAGSSRSVTKGRCTAPGTCCRALPPCGAGSSFPHLRSRKRGARAGELSSVVPESSPDMARREREQGSAGQRAAGIARTVSVLEAAQPQLGSLGRSSHLWPATMVSRERLQPLQKMDTNRSIRRGSQGTGSWGRSMGRLSISPGSTRRKELKEILLQSNSPSSTMRLATAQKTSNSSSLLAGQHQELKPEQNPEVLSLALDPLEHEWLLTVAEGDADNIIRLLDLDPSLLTRKDFVTGFTALHWLAKHGHHESFIQVISHAQRKGYPVNVNIPTASGGLTPLHLATLQGHELLIKLLVGAYGADTSLRDHNGRKAWQYLRADTSRELKELAGALEDDLVQLCSHNTNNNWRAGTDKQNMPPSCQRFPAPSEIPGSPPYASPLGCCLFMTDKLFLSKARAGAWFARGAFQVQDKSPSLGISIQGHLRCSAPLEMGARAEEAGGTPSGVSCSSSHGDWSPRAALER